VREKKRSSAITSTSSSGISERVQHDSSEFYNSKLYEGLPVEFDVGKEQDFPNNLTNTLLCQKSQSLNQIPSNSIHLCVTSPPYNVGKEYEDCETLPDYLKTMQHVFDEVYRVLAPGGRLAINLANLGRKPYLPLVSFFNHMLLKIGFLMRGEVIWDKAASAAPSVAWGSWLSPSNPVLRDVHEYVLIFSKGSFGRKNVDKESKCATIEKDEFIEWTKSVWKFPTESAKRVGHPAPFPVELPRRLIKLFSFTNDVILDPFAGSCTTAIAAMELNRKYICVDSNPEYIELGRNRIEEYSSIH
jgi:modification methylase